jgi:hypothetical protein
VDNEFRNQKVASFIDVDERIETDNVFQDFQIVRQFCRPFPPCLPPFMAASLMSGGMAVEVHETALVVELGQQTAEYGGLLR